MKVKVLAEGKYEIVAVMDGVACPAEDFLTTGEADTRVNRQGLFQMLKLVADWGLQGVPSGWWHEANKQEKIYEFIRGPLRLFFFKGEGSQIAVCTGGVRKKGSKADKGSVTAASSSRKAYLSAIQAQTLEIMRDEENQ